MRHKFTLRQLEYFVAAASCGQISVAADACSVTQSAMTLAIAGLEESLGARLFDRVRGGIVLTHQGEVFLHRAKSVLDVANETSRFPFHENSDLHGELVIATTYMVLGYFLLRWLDSFSKMFPHVTVVPLEFERSQIERDLKSGKLSMAALMLNNLEAPRQLNTLSLTHSRRKVWVSHKHPLAGRESVTLDELADFTYIVPRVDDGEMNVHRRWDNAQRKPQNWLYASSLEAVREMVAIGFGITILPDVFFHPWSLDGRRIHTVAISDPVPVPDIDIGLAWRDESLLTPPAVAFRDFLRQSLNLSAGL